MAKIPLNAEGRRVPKLGTRLRTRRTARPCRSYGAGHIMRVPGRLHIHWADDDTLQVDTGFGDADSSLSASPTPTPMEPAAPSWQEDTRRAARGWDRTSPPRVIAYAAFYRPPNAPRYLGGDHNALAAGGILLKNGVPYSEDARVEEHFYTFTEPNGDTWLVVTTIITDPRYLIEPYVTPPTSSRNRPTIQVGIRRPAGWIIPVDGTLPGDRDEHRSSQEITI